MTQEWIDQVKQRQKNRQRINGSHHVDAQYQQAEADLAAAMERIARYEDAKINWFTDCDSCCHLLDSNYELYVEREEARRERDDARALADQLAHTLLRFPNVGYTEYAQMWSGERKEALAAYDQRSWGGRSDPRESTQGVRLCP